MLIGLLLSMLRSSVWLRVCGSRAAGRVGRSKSQVLCVLLKMHDQVMHISARIKMHREQHCPAVLLRFIRF